MVKIQSKLNIFLLAGVLYLGMLFNDLSYSQELINELGLSPEEKAWISEHRSIRVTSQMDWPPFDFVQEGVVSGFSIDYLRLLSDKVGINFEFVNGYSWEELSEQLENKEIDLTHSIMQTPKRDEFLNFTAPYINLPFVYYGRVGSSHINSVDDLKGKRIGFVDGFAHEQIYNDNYPNLTLVKTRSVNDALIALSAGEIDVFSTTLPVASYLISKNFIAGVEVIGRDVLPEFEGYFSLRLGVRNDWPVLSNILKKGMGAISTEEFRGLSDQWLAQYRAENINNLSPEELGWLRENRIIKVAADPSVAPVEFINEAGEIDGISGEFLTRIAAKLNVKFEWSENKNWDDGITMMRSGEAAVLSGVFPTEDRRDFLNFTDSYLTVSTVIFSREGGAVYGNMEGLANSRLAQIKNTSVLGYIKRDYPDYEIIEADTLVECLQLVASGKADAYVGDIPITALNIANEGFDQIIVTGDTPYIGRFAMGISRNYPLLFSAMQKAMQSFTANEKAEISRKWIVLRSKGNPDYKLIWQVTLGAVFIISMVLIWVFSLKKEVKRRELVERKLVKSQAAAEAANVAKSTFLANMSHEVRTPLNAIIGFSDVMSSEVYGKIEQAKYREYIEDIKGSGEHLSTVINDILDLSKIEAGKWEISEKEFNLNDCITETFKMFENELIEKNLSLDLENNDGQITLSGDENCIKRIIINLISNSVKNTENGGRIDCQVSTNENNDVSISIKDTGIGIPEDRLDMVLDPFEQIQDDFLVNEPGTGLGLSIVKNLVELHDGFFYLNSEMGVGTEAVIILPAERIVT